MANVFQFCRCAKPCIAGKQGSDLYGWAEALAEKFGLDQDSFQDKTVEFFYAFGYIQISLGYVFLSLREVSNPSGSKSKVNLNSQSRQVSEESDSSIRAKYHYWYHHDNSWESIYRAWERITNVLVSRFTPNNTDKHYFNTYVELLEKKCVLGEQLIKDLRKFEKAWNTIACNRNEFTHGKSNFFRYEKVDIRLSEIVDQRGDRIIDAELNLPNLKQKTSSLIDKYRKSFQLLEKVKELCELDILPIK